ncbi:MAG: hypothetical protein AAF346_25970 [Pseudomonadota bacterium]
MTDAKDIETIRQSLKVLLTRVETIEGYARRHGPEIHEVLRQAREAGRRQGLSWFRILQNAVVAFFHSTSAISQMLRHLSAVQSMGSRKVVAVA